MLMTLTNPILHNTNHLVLSPNGSNGGYSQEDDQNRPSTPCTDNSDEDNTRTQNSHDDDDDKNNIKNLNENLGRNENLSERNESCESAAQIQAQGQSKSISTSSKQEATPLLRRSSSNGGGKKNSSKNKYGSVEDLQVYALGLQNSNLATELVDAKHSWDTLQQSYRANTHARFVYQTTLARIVAHVQDFGTGDGDDPTLIEDILKWDAECEKLDPNDAAANEENINKETKNNHTGGGQGSDLDLDACYHHEYDCPELDGPNINSSPVAAKRKSKIHNGPIIIDWNDVESTASSERLSLSTGGLSQFCRSHHDSFGEQNDCLKCEIQKYKASMARIRACNRYEVHELLKHQRTIAKVVDRIQQSSFRFTDTVIQWYEECQQEAKRCGSFSEQDAEEYISNSTTAREKSKQQHKGTDPKKEQSNPITALTTKPDSQSIGPKPIHQTDAPQFGYSDSMDREDGTSRTLSSEDSHRTTDDPGEILRGTASAIGGTFNNDPSSLCSKSTTPTVGNNASSPLKVTSSPSSSGPSTTKTRNNVAVASSTSGNTSETNCGCIVM